MSVHAPLAGALAARRERFNARMAQTRCRHPGFDTTAFAAFLATALDEVVSAVDKVAPEQVHRVTAAGYETALTLVAHGLVGPAARHAWVERVWRELAVRRADLLATDPRGVLGGMGNAVIELTRWPGVRVDDWLQEMEALAARVDSVAQWRVLGQLLAWHSGMAHYRRGALLAAECLPANLALAALGADASLDWPVLREACLADPWHAPQGRAYGVPDSGVQVGAFTGFGGVFAEPPEVRASGDDIFVRSADQYWRVVADIRGAVLLPASESLWAAAAPGTAAPSSGCGEALGWPRQTVVAATTTHTVALSTPCSHRIALFARP